MCPHTAAATTNTHSWCWAKAASLNGVHHADRVCAQRGSFVLLRQRWAAAQERGREKAPCRDNLGAKSWTGNCGEYFIPLSLSFLSLISAAVSSQHNSLWVTFVSKTFHPMKMFYLISKSSIFFVTDRAPYITMSGESLAVKLIRVDNGWIESEPFVFLPTSLPSMWEPFQEGES